LRQLLAIFAQSTAIFGMMLEKKTSIRPLLRWAGSKRQLIPKLSEYWSTDYKRYVEPFAGSACLYHHLQPKRALLGDLNSELIQMYNQIKLNPEAVIRYLKKLSNDKKSYLAVRKQSPEDLLPEKAAARFLFLNRFCLNGLFRTNKEGKFNVPYGGEKSGRIVTAEEIQRVSKLLQKATLISGDFE